MKTFLRKGVVSLTVVVRKDSEPIDGEDILALFLKPIDGDGASYNIAPIPVSADTFSVMLDTDKFYAGTYKICVIVNSDELTYSGESEEFALTDSIALVTFDTQGRHIPIYNIDAANTTMPESFVPEDIQKWLEDPDNVGGIIKCVYLYDIMSLWASNLNPDTGKPIVPDKTMPKHGSHVDTANAYTLLRIMSRINSLEGKGTGAKHWFYKFVDKEYPDGEKGNAVSGISVNPAEDADGNHTVTVEYDRNFLDLLKATLQEVLGEVKFKDAVTVKKTFTVGEPPVDDPEDNAEVAAKKRAAYLKRLNETVSAFLYGGCKIVGELQVAGTITHEGDYIHTGDLKNTGKFIQTGDVAILGDIVEDVSKKRIIVDSATPPVKEGHVVYYESVTVEVETQPDGNSKRKIKAKAVNELVERYVAVNDIKSAVVGAYSWRIDGKEVLRLDPNGLAGDPEAISILNHIIPSGDGANIGTPELPYSFAYLKNIFGDNFTKVYEFNEAAGVMKLRIYGKQADGSIVEDEPDVELALKGDRDNLSTASIKIRNKENPRRSITLRLDRTGLYYNDSKIAPLDEATWAHRNIEEFEETAGVVAKGDSVRKAIYKLQTQISGVLSTYIGDIYVNDLAVNTKFDGTLSYPFHKLADAIACVESMELTKNIIHVLHLAEDEEITINGARNLTIQGENDKLAGYPIIRKLYVGTNDSVLFDRLQIDTDLVLTGSGAVSFMRCAFNGITADVAINKPTVVFEQCTFGSNVIGIGGGEILFLGCTQHRDGVVEQAITSEVTSKVTIVDCNNFSYIHHAGSIWIDGSNLTGSPYIAQRYPYQPIVGDAGRAFVSDATDDAANIVHLNYVSFDNELNGDEFYSVRIDACRRVFAGVSRYREADSIAGSQIYRGLQDVDIISFDRSLYSIDEPNAQGKLDRIDDNFAAGINLLSNANIITNPGRYDYGIGGGIVVTKNPNEALITHLPGSGSLVRMTIPRKYRADYDGLMLTACLELKIYALDVTQAAAKDTFNLEVPDSEIVTIMENGNVTKELTHELFSDQFCLVPIQFKWEQDADLVLSWQVNEAFRSMAVRNGVMLTLGRGLSVWRKSPFENVIEDTSNRNYAVGTFANQNFPRDRVKLRYQEPLSEGCVDMTVDKVLYLHNERNLGDGNGFEHKDSDTHFSVSVMLDANEAISGNVGYEVALFERGSGDPVEVGRIELPVDTPAGIYHLQGSWNILDYIPNAKHVTARIIGINTGDIDVSYSQVQIIKGSRIGSYQPAYEDDYIIRPLGGIELDPTKASGNILAQRVRNTYHIEGLLECINMDYDNPNLLATGVQLQALDREFINNRTFPVSIIPGADFHDVTFGGYMRITDDKLYLHITKGHHEADNDIICFSADFNIINPSFNV